MSFQDDFDTVIPRPVTPTDQVPEEAWDDED